MLKRTSYRKMATKDWGIQSITFSPWDMLEKMQDFFSFLVFLLGIEAGYMNKTNSYIDRLTVWNIFSSKSR